MSGYQAYVDSLILKALQEDDDKPLSHLFEYYYNRLYRVGLRWCADATLTEECIQEVFLDLWLYRHTLGNIISLETYLKVALRRRIFRKLKKNDPLSNATNVDADAIHSVMTTESYEDLLIQQQSDAAKRQKLITALDCLTPKQREVVCLKYFEELSYKEIAIRTDLEIGNLYKILHDAIKKLKIALQ
jgi:RNA polymerase sigma-70 factor (ECF subfamily)